VKNAMQIVMYLTFTMVLVIVPSVCSSGDYTDDEIEDILAELDERSDYLPDYKLMANDGTISHKVSLSRCNGLNRILHDNSDNNDLVRFNDLCAVIEIVNLSPSDQLCFNTIVDDLSDYKLYIPPPRVISLNVNGKPLLPGLTGAEIFGHEYLAYDRRKKTEDWNEMRVLAPKGGAYRRIIWLSKSYWYSIRKGDEVFVEYIDNIFVCSTISRDRENISAIPIESRSNRLNIAW
jgi:hypothetical protein